MNSNIEKLKNICGREDGKIDYYRLNSYLLDNGVIETKHGSTSDYNDGIVHIFYSHVSIKKTFALTANLNDIESFAPIVDYVESCKALNMVIGSLKKISGVDPYEEEITPEQLQNILYDIYEYLLVKFQDLGI